MTLLSKATPKCDVQFFSQEVFTARFVGYCQLYGQLDAANVPNFQILGDVENATFILDNIYLLVAFLEHNSELFGYTRLFLQGSVSKGSVRFDNRQGNAIERTSSMVSINLPLIPCHIVL